MFSITHNFEFSAWKLNNKHHAYSNFHYFAVAVNAIIISSRQVDTCSKEMSAHIIYFSAISSVAFKWLQQRISLLILSWVFYIIT